MNLHPMFQVVPRFLAAMAATGIVVACGARSDLGGYCNLPALAYCRTNGCPLIGPLPTSSFDSWCAGTGAFASSVSGLSTCSSPTQPGILTDVAAGQVNCDPTCNANSLVDLYYDPTGVLVAVVLSQNLDMAYGCDVASYYCSGTGKACPP